MTENLLVELAVDVYEGISERALSVFHSFHILIAQRTKLSRLFLTFNNSWIGDKHLL